MSLHVQGRAVTAMRRRIWLALLMLAVSSAAAIASPDQPTAETEAAFQRYVRLTEARVESELRREGPYLWVDLQPGKREEYRRQLRAGEVVIESLQTRDGGKEIECPGGDIHHWIGTVFIPGVTLDQYLAFVQDYNRHQEHFQPDVARSQLLERKGDDFRVFFRFYKSKFGISPTHDTWHDIHYFRLSPARAGSRTRTTRILDVADPGKPSERHRSPEEDRGYLWRLYTWWRFEERDGGVYVQSESVSLTRHVPWIAKPFVSGLPRDQLTRTLGASRTALLKLTAAAK